MDHQITLVFENAEDCAWSLRQFQQIQQLTRLGLGRKLAPPSVEILMESLEKVSRVESTMNDDEAFKIRMGTA